MTGPTIGHRRVPDRAPRRARAGDDQDRHPPRGRRRPRRSAPAPTAAPVGGCHDAWVAGLRRRLGLGDGVADAVLTSLTEPDLADAAEPARSRLLDTAAIDAWLGE
jgi:hypothetical protein